MADSQLQDGESLGSAVTQAAPTTATPTDTSTAMSMTPHPALGEGESLGAPVAEQTTPETPSWLSRAGDWADRQADKVAHATMPYVSPANKASHPELAAHPFSVAAQMSTEAGQEVGEAVARGTQPLISASEKARYPDLAKASQGSVEGIGKFVGGMVGDPHNWPFLAS